MSLKIKKCYKYRGTALPPPSRLCRLKGKRFLKTRPPSAFEIPIVYMSHSIPRSDTILNIEELIHVLYSVSPRSSSFIRLHVWTLHSHCLARQYWSTRLIVNYIWQLVITYVTDCHDIKSYHTTYISMTLWHTVVWQYDILLLLMILHSLQC